MSVVNLMNVTVLDNPTEFLNQFQFEITFECSQELEDGVYLFGTRWQQMRKFRPTAKRNIGELDIISYIEF